MDYSTFGSLMPGRNQSSEDYRFGYQGSEKDDEITGVEGAHITTPLTVLSLKRGKAGKRLRTTTTE